MLFRSEGQSDVGIVASVGRPASSSGTSAEPRFPRRGRRVTAADGRPPADGARVRLRRTRNLVDRIFISGTAYVFQTDLPSNARAHASVQPRREPEPRRADCCHPENRNLVDRILISGTAQVIRADL